MTNSITGFNTGINTGEQMVAFILTLFSEHGAREYMGEPVSMAQHMNKRLRWRIIKVHPTALSPLLIA